MPYVIHYRERQARQRRRKRKRMSYIGGEIYKVHQIACNNGLEKFTVYKLDDDFKLEGTNDVHRGNSGRLQCSCFQGAKEDCRHRWMVRKVIDDGMLNEPVFWDFKHEKYVTAVGSDSEGTVLPKPLTQEDSERIVNEPSTKNDSMRGV